MEPSAAITAPSCGRWSRRSGDTRHLPWPRDDLAFGPVLRDECLGGHSLHSEPWGEPVSPWASPDLQFLFLKKGKEERKDLSKTQSSPKSPRITITKSSPKSHSQNPQNIPRITKKMNKISPRMTQGSLDLDLATSLVIELTDTFIFSATSVWVSFCLVVLAVEQLLA